MPSRLVVKVTAGAEAPERCAQTFKVSSIAAASGVPVSLWLTGEASWFALHGRAETFELPHSAPLVELRDTILSAGMITLCTQWAARRGIKQEDVLDGVRLAGAAVFVGEALEDGVQALVY